MAVLTPAVSAALITPVAVGGKPAPGMGGNYDHVYTSQSMMGASWIEVAPPGAQSRIVLYPRAMIQNWGSMKPSITFHCDDVEATHADLSPRGVRFIQPSTTMPWGTFA